MPKQLLALFQSTKILNIWKIVLKIFFLLKDIQVLQKIIDIVIWFIIIISFNPIVIRRLDIKIH